MEYPTEFSQQARAHVVAEQLKAAQRLEHLKSRKPSEEWTKGLRIFDQCAFYEYILGVFLAFAHEACKLGDQGIWGVDRIASEADEFLRALAVEAYYEKGHDRYGRQFPEITDHFGGRLLPAVARSLKDSDEWRQFETELLAVAQKQAAYNPGNRANEAEPKWESIEISFLSDERVQVSNGKNQATYNYDELGFGDGRNGRPNQSWVTLRDMAEANGLIRDGAKTGAAWTKVEKRIQEIRRVLRRHFGIMADPIPLVEGSGYQACFKIRCGPSFRS
jgi:hypothetical protein